MSEGIRKVRAFRKESLSVLSLKGILFYGQISHRHTFHPVSNIALIVSYIKGTCIFQVQCSPLQNKALLASLGLLA